MYLAKFSLWQQFQMGTFSLKVWNFEKEMLMIFSFWEKKLSVKK